MAKILSLAVIAVVSTMFDTPAFAQFGTHDRGPDVGVFNCPPNTCGPRGGPRATNIKLCKKENCPKK